MIWDVTILLWQFSFLQHYPNWGFPDISVCKESTCNAGNPGSIPASERSPENSMYHIVHGIAKSQTQLTDFHFHPSWNLSQYCLHIFTSNHSNELPSHPWFALTVKFSLVQLSRSVVSDSLRPHELQHSRPPCPSPTPIVYPNSCPLSRWCHPAISSSLISFSSHLQSFPASGSFQMSQLFTSDRQSIGVSASTLVLPMNTQDWSPLGWTGWISLQSRGFLDSLFLHFIFNHYSKSNSLIPPAATV